MPFRSPFFLGPFLVDQEGRLSPRNPEAPPNFLFQWHDRVIRASLEAGSDEGVLRISAVLGRVPSTATESGITRSQVFDVVRGLAGTVPSDWRLGLLPNHRVMLQAHCPVALPITATGLLTQITSFLLRLSPYLELVDETGLRPGGADAGALLN
ncbi:MAG: hypothetical protein AB7F35_16880 [Acetobacteraceae bacterium]